MSEIWRLLDTGLQSPLRNLALSHALLEAHHAHEIPSTLHFARSTCGVLVAPSDPVAQVVDLNFCQQNAVPIYRRVTSGPTTYIDERYLFCELYVDRRDIGSSDLRAGIKRFCHAIATAISALGIDARQRRGTEVEVGGRVIATAGAVLDGGAVLMQAALLMRQAPRPAQALRVFAGTLGNAAAQAAFERTAALEYLLGSNVDVPKIKHNLAEAFESDFDVEMREGDMTLSEEKRCQKALRLHQSSAFAPVLAATQADLRVLEATHACRAAVLRALILYDSDAHAVRHAWFSEGTSPRLRPETLALESALRDSPVNQVAERIRHFFSSRAVDPAIPTADDFTTVMHRAIKQPFPASSDKH